jgi:opacity protein-like surface antigen
MRSRSTSAWLAATAAAAALVLAPRGAAADPARIETPAERAPVHVYAGLFGSGVVAVAQATDYRRGYLGNGGGGGLFVGVRLGPLVSIELDGRVTRNAERFAAARVTNIAVGGLAVTTLTGGVRLHWPLGGILEPYGRLGAGYAAIVASYPDCAACDTVFATGQAVELGGGVDVSVSERITVGVRAGGQLLHFGEDAFERRLRQPDRTPSRTRAAIFSATADLTAAFHF